jgi:hypothetical protein
LLQDKKKRDGEAQVATANKLLAKQRRDALEAKLLALKLSRTKKTDAAQKSGTIKLDTLAAYLKPPFEQGLDWAIAKVKEARGVAVAAAQ